MKVKSKKLNIVKNGKVIARLNTTKQSVIEELKNLGYSVEEPVVKLSTDKQRIILEIDADPYLIEKLLDQYCPDGTINLITVRVRDLPIKGSIVEDWCESSRVLHKFVNNKLQKRVKKLA